MRALAFFLVLLVMASVVPLVVWATINLRKRTGNNIRQLASQLGLIFQPPKNWTALARAAGAWRGKPAEIFTYATGSGKSRQTWAAFTLRPANPGAFTFTLRKQGLTTKIMEFFGRHEITVGEATFDAAWFVQTNEPDFFRAALIPELRNKLMNHQRAFSAGKFELKDGVLKYFELGSFTDAAQAARFAAVADVMGDLADVAEVAGTQTKA